MIKIIIVIIIIALFVSTRISMTGMSEKARSRIGIADWYRYVTNSRKRHQRWTVSCHRPTCKSQEQVHERLLTKQRIFISQQLVNEVTAICMDGQYYKSCLQMVSNDKKTCLSSIKNLYKTTMKTLKRDAFLRLMLRIPRSYRSYAVICYSYPKNEDWQVWKTCVSFVPQEKLCDKHKSYESGTGLWANTRKGPQSNWVHTRSMV